MSNFEAERTLVQVSPPTLGLTEDRWSTPDGENLENHEVDNTQYMPVMKYYAHMSHHAQLIITGMNMFALHGTARSRHSWHLINVSDQFPQGFLLHNRK